MTFPSLRWRSVAGEFAVRDISIKTNLGEFNEQISQGAFFPLLFAARSRGPLKES